MRKVEAGFNDEDRQLLEAIVQRNKKSFEMLYKKYYQRLFAVAHRYVEHTEVAEEIVHDVFITIWNKADQLNIQHSMKSYLFKSIVNSALNFIKKDKANAEKQLLFAASNNLETIPEDDAANTEEALLNALEDALKLLPEKCRQVMYLSRFGKLKQQEIADQMEISIKTVKNHLTYGFQKLREHLEQRKKTIVTILMLLNILTP